MTANILGLLLPVGALFVAGASSKPKPGGTAPGGSATVTDDAANALCEVRIVEGQPVRCFRSQVVDMTLAALGESYLVPAPGAPSPEVAAYDVVPIANVGRQPGAATAQQIVAQVASQGLVVLGSLTLPIPTVGGRQVLIGQPKARAIAGTGYKFPFALLLDKALAQSTAAPSVPVYTPGPAAPGVPPTTPGTSNPAPWVPGPSAPPVPPGDEMPGTYAPYSDLDPNLPPTVRAQVEGLLSDDSMDPAALDDAAKAMAASFPKAAQKLRARAAELRTLRELEATRRGGTPHVIRPGDTGSFLAKYYTGDANRWRDLPAANPGMRVVGTGTSTQLAPWSGEILLPLSWRAWTKPEPPLQTGSAPRSGKAPTTTKPPKNAGITTGPTKAQARG